MITAVIAAAWLGAMTVFVSTVSPTVFQTLEMPDASRFLRAYFPKLFRLEIGVGVAITVAGFAAQNTLFGAIGMAMAVLAASNLWILTDRINQIADRLQADPDNRQLKRQFGLSHGASAALFGLGGLGCLWIVGQTLWEIL